MKQCLLHGLVLVSALAMAPALLAQTEAQAKAGSTLYGDKCLKCHDTSGEGMGPSLKGESFWKEWDGKPARALYSRIISTMPADDPGSLEEKDVVSIVTFLLQSNGLPMSGKEIQSPNEWNTLPLNQPK